MILIVQVTPTASFKDDLQLDILDNNQVMIAVEEEFAVGIPENEANKLSTTAHLIDYLTAHPQAKWDSLWLPGEITNVAMFFTINVLFIDSL